MFVKQDKRLAKLVAAAFAFNSVGTMAIPIVSAAEQANKSTQTDAEKAKNAEEAQKAAAYKAAVDAAVKNNTIQLNDDDDDLVFLNKIISLCTDKNKKTTVAENYNALIEGARQAQAQAEAAGKEPDVMTQKFIKADDRVHKIANKLKDSGTLKFETATANLIESYKGIYQQGIADKQNCEAKARNEGKDPSACKLSPEAASAANFLLTNDVQQINVTATSPEKTNAVEKKGASTIKNTDSHWYRGDDGLWHEKTDVKEVKCGDDEEAKDGKCVKKETPKEETKKDDVKCGDGEELKDGKCVKKETPKEEVKKDDVKCGENEELKDGKCVKKEAPKTDETECAETEELKDGKCVAKEVKCGEDEELKDGKCVKKQVCPTNYVESEGNCCPADHPKYDANTKQCVVKDKEKKAETPTPTDNGGNSGGGNSLLTALGTLGALAAMLPGGGGGAGGGQRDVINENGLQYAFNYLHGKNLGKDKKAIHMFPQNSNDPIKFKLFQYRLPKAPDGTTVKPKAEAHVMVTLFDKNTKKWTGKTIVIPLELNKMEMLFPKTTGEGGAIYKPLAQFGEIERVPASTFGLPYYTMTVVADDGISGHLREFNIHYDFTTESTYIQANPDKKLSKGTNVIQGSAPTIGVDGYVQGATWNAQDGTCTIGIRGTFIDNAANERYDSGDEAHSIVSDRYTEEGCNKINKAAQNGKAAVHIEGLTNTDDGHGNRILSDKDAQGAKIAIYDDAATYKNDGVQKYNEGILKYTDYKEKYQDDLVYARRPASFYVKYADGTPQEWAGYSSDGKTLYDTDGNELTESQKAGEVKILYNTTKNPEYKDLVKVDACSANHDPDRLGQVCGFKPNGEEIPLSSGHGFDRNTIEAAGNIGKEKADKEGNFNTAQALFDKAGKYIDSATSGVFRSVTNTIGDVTKGVFFGPLVGVDSAAKSGEKKTIDEVAHTENKDAKDKKVAQKANNEMKHQEDMVNQLNGTTQSAGESQGSPAQEAPSAKTVQVKASGKTQDELMANARTQALQTMGVSNGKVHVTGNNIHKTNDGIYEGVVTVTVQPQ